MLHDCVTKGRVEWLSRQRGYDVHRAEVNRYLLESASVLRPSLGKRRVLNEAVQSLESRVRNLADDLIHRQACRGRAIKTQRSDVEVVTEEQLETSSVRVLADALLMRCWRRERGSGVVLFFRY